MDGFGWFWSILLLSEGLPTILYTQMDHITARLRRRPPSGFLGSASERAPGRTVEGPRGGERSGDGGLLLPLFVRDRGTCKTTLVVCV